MQSTTWPWRSEVYCCCRSYALRRYRIATVRGIAVCDWLFFNRNISRHFVLVGGKQPIDPVFSALSSSTENQNLFLYPVGCKYPPIVPEYPLVVNEISLVGKFISPVCPASGQHLRTRDISCIPCWWVMWLSEEYPFCVAGTKCIHFMVWVVDWPQSCCL